MGTIRLNAMNLPLSQSLAFSTETLKIRHAIQSTDPTVLTRIYEEETNMAIWQRQLSQTLEDSVSELLKTSPKFKMSMTVTPHDALVNIQKSFGTKNLYDLSEDIANLVDMFCSLFDLKQAGLRLTALDQAMCPKFHVDKVPCRLITTYCNVATEWLPHQTVNREKLGAGSNGESDHKSGLFKSENNIQRLNCGDVALLKGENWEGNEDAGLVHRSPVIESGQKRLLLTLDFSY